MTPRSQLIVCGVSLSLWCGALNIQSFSFVLQRPLADRPVLMFTAGLLFATAISLLALRAAIHCRRTAGLTTLILGMAVGMRLLLLPSHPIQELDIYRYMWDGLVTNETGNPWQFSPKLVRESPRDTGPPELARLTELRDSAPGIRQVLDRVHYAELTTIYPPVSQAVFAAAAAITPQHATARTRLQITRAVITLFDILTIVAILTLLQLLGKPAGWSVAYAWSPLVLKEFANSGHLDSIAICLATWAVVCWISGLQRRCNGRLAAGATLLGLAIGAKLFPVVLVPVVAVSVWRRAGATAFAISGVTLVAVTALALAPLIAHRWPTTEQSTDITTTHGSSASGADTLQSGEGLDQFLQRWKMNHFFFRLIEENLTPNSAAWFAVTPQSLRVAATNPVAERLQIGRPQAAFLITRCLTTLITGAIIFALCRPVWSATDRRLLQASFLSLAWFWLLLPTMNPWYWIWAMPLLPFARLRTWLLMSGCVGLYYTRFWLTNSLQLPSVPGTPYSGRQFFYYVVVWIEYLPWCCLLFTEWCRRRRKKKASQVV